MAKTQPCCPVSKNKLCHGPSGLDFHPSIPTSLCLLTLVYIIPPLLRSPNERIVPSPTVTNYKSYQLSLVRAYRLSLTVDFFRFSQRSAMLYAVVVSACLSVHQKSAFYRNDWTNRAGFWHGGFLPLIPHCVIRRFVYLQKLPDFTW